jgi:hypothetical protein
MKVLTWCRVVFSGVLGLLILLTITQDFSLQAKHGGCISTESKKFKLKKLSNENEIIKDASAKIRSNLKKAGHPCSIRCTYELSGSNAISTTTKVYYEEYHKRPDFFKECHLHEAIPADKVVEVLYNKHDKSMSLSVKNPRHKHEKISTKEVVVPESLLAA